MGSQANRVSCGVVECMKRNALRWFGHGEDGGVRSMSKSVGPNSRGRPPGRWRDRVKEYMCERGAARGGGMEQAKRKCLDRERWRLFCLGGCSRREGGIIAIDKWIVCPESLLSLHCHTITCVNHVVYQFTFSKPSISLQSVVVLLVGNTGNTAGRHTSCPAPPLLPTTSPARRLLDAVPPDGTCVRPRHTDHPHTPHTPTHQCK